MLLLSIVVTLLQLLTSSFAAYSFAKLHSRHKNALFLAYIDHRHALAYLHGAPVHHDAEDGAEGIDCEKTPGPFCKQPSEIYDCQS